MYIAHFKIMIPHRLALSGCHVLCTRKVFTVFPLQIIRERKAVLKNEVLFINIYCLLFVSLVMLCREGKRE